jgi:hypothetical protein
MPGVGGHSLFLKSSVYFIFCVSFVYHFMNLILVYSFNNLTALRNVSLIKDGLFLRLALGRFGWNAHGSFCQAFSWKQRGPL